MSLYESMFRGVLFPAYETVLRRRKTLQYLDEFERNQWLDPERIRQLQWEKLQHLIRYCWDEVPYYRERWSEVGATPGDIRNAEDYARLPVLTKNDIRANFDRLIAPGFRHSLLYKATGGSTGEPLRLAITRESYEKRVACMFRGYGWAGARPGQRTLYLWAGNFEPTWQQKAKDRMHRAVFNRRMLDVLAMKDSNLADYVARINAFRPETIVAYTSPAVELAKWILDNNASVHRPERVLTAAEALYDHQRDILQRAFGCPVYNTYGCREFMLIAAECEHQDGLHVNSDQLFVEILPEQPEESGGDLVVTDLSNYGMPFLRYVNGDMATRGSEASCACGRGLPKLKRIDGRKLDVIRTANGHRLPGEFFPHMLMHVRGVKKFQVLQRRIDEIRISIVSDEEFTHVEEDSIRRHIEDMIGPDTSIVILRTDDIPLTRSGKLRVTVSELP